MRRFVRVVLPWLVLMLAIMSFIPPVFAGKHVSQNASTFVSDLDDP